VQPGVLKKAEAPMHDIGASGAEPQLTGPSGPTEVSPGLLSACLDGQRAPFATIEHLSQIEDFCKALAPGERCATAPTAAAMLVSPLSGPSCPVSVPCQVARRPALGNNAARRLRISEIRNSDRRSREAVAERKLACRSACLEIRIIRPDSLPCRNCVSFGRA